MPREINNHNLRWLLLVIRVLCEKLESRCRNFYPNAALEHCYQGKGPEAESLLIMIKHYMETRRPPRKRVLHDDGVLDDEERDDMTSSE